MWVNPIVNLACVNSLFHCLLHAVINGEKAAYSTPVFADKRERTLDLLLKNIEQKNYTTKVRQGIKTMCICLNCS